MNSMTLTEFLLARIAEDEAATRRLLRYAQENELAVSDPKLLGRHIPGWHEWPDVQAMCFRVLAECEAKRHIIERYVEPVDHEENGYEHAVGRIVGLSEAVRLLALPYADHPDYREGWSLSLMAR